MDFAYDVDFCDPSKFSPDPHSFHEELLETEEQFSLIFDYRNQHIRKRSSDVFLKPICIDGLDVSNKFSKMMNKKNESYRLDRSILNVKSITLTLWYFISRGHTAVAFLPTKLREMAGKCSDPHQLYTLFKMGLVIFDEHETVSPDLPRTIAICAQNSYGCIVGSRKKYAKLAEKMPDISRVVNTGFIRPIFTSFNSMRTNEKVHTVASLNDVRIHNCDEGPLSFQLLASDQLFLMIKLAKMLNNEKYLELCGRVRELKISSSTGCMQLKNFVVSKTSGSRMGNYHYTDVFLPEYVAPPPPRWDDSRKATRIGNKNSIYRVGEEGDEKKSRKNMDLSMALKGPLIEALEQLFGREKALRLVRENPECDEINDLIEIGISDQ